MGYVRRKTTESHYYWYSLWTFSVVVTSGTDESQTVKNYRMIPSLVRVDKTDWTNHSDPHHATPVLPLWPFNAFIVCLPIIVRWVRGRSHKGMNVGVSWPLVLSAAKDAKK